MAQLAEEAPSFARGEVRDQPNWAGSIVGENRDISPAPHGSASGTQRYLLMLQFAVVNLAAFALLGAAYLQGWVATVVEAGITGLSIAIFAVILGGLAVCARKIWAISCELNCVRNFDPCRRSWAATYLTEVTGRESGSRAITGSVLRVRISSRIVVVRHVANSLVLLGLIGTVLGFATAASSRWPS